MAQHKARAPTLSMKFSQMAVVHTARTRPRAHPHAHGIHAHARTPAPRNQPPDSLPTHRNSFRGCRTDRLWRAICARRIRLTSRSALLPALRSPSCLRAGCTRAALIRSGILSQEPEIEQPKQRAPVPIAARKTEWNTRYKSEHRVHCQSSETLPRKALIKVSRGACVPVRHLTLLCARSARPRRHSRMWAGVACVRFCV